MQRKKKYLSCVFFFSLNQCHYPRSTFNHWNDKYGSASRNKEEDDEVHSKRIKLTVTEAELVGLVVGTAVKTILN